LGGRDAGTERLRVAERFGASATLAPGDRLLETIKDATRGRGVDVSIEALGIQSTFDNELSVLRPGGTLSSVGVYCWLRADPD
jgi:threonine dehydrogenase-like Zn-dependent dehydrogenase